MRKLADLNLNTLIVTEDADMGSALLSMQKGGVAAAAVLRKGEFLGFVTIESAVLSEPNTPVSDFLRRASAHLEAQDAIRSASKKFVQQQADFLPVFEGKRFLGIVSALALITELGRSYDPLTELSWSDALRDWGVDRLELGQELCVIFFDLDNFGVYNKTYGHLVGDHVLQGFAKLLSKRIDSTKDMLVRYGGDEFALATIRPREEIADWLSTLQDRQFNIPEIPAPVTFSYGLSGGKRTTEPSRDHVAATLDNLISLASKDCLANKPQSEDREPTKHQRTAPLPATSDWMRIATHAAHQAASASQSTIEIYDTLFIRGDKEQHQVVVTGKMAQDGQEYAFRSVKPITADLEKTIREAVWEGALLR